MGHYNSFVVRLWSDEQGRVRGRIEDVRSQESLLFVDLAEIFGFIRARLGPASAVMPPFLAAADGPGAGSTSAGDGEPPHDWLDADPGVWDEK